MVPAPLPEPAAAAPAAPRLANWPVDGRISSYFGARLGGFHNGLDIAAPMYTPIRATQAGVVQVAGQPYLSYGDTADIVMIAHASNFSTVVAAGQVIAYVGLTGWTTGPHVHFMTIYNQRPIDPLQVLP
ncbi:MAG: hypothetical protein AUH85_12905 [Chloroflexi bacterium 13_1_40CM_4_68_4]|nr:MAG: hypothetical protein AUH85_12905 [Chloroflexi bacterium 13_1_40CM_4_68_4]